MIGISNLGVGVGAKPGTVVGTLSAYDATGATLAVRFQVENESLFAIDANGNLVVNVALPIAGYYAVHLYAVQGNEVVDEGDFNVKVG